MVPWLPIQSVPPGGSGLPSAKSAGGFFPPSYQVRVTGGRVLPDAFEIRSGNWNRMICQAGADCCVTPLEVASTETGAPNSSAQYAESTMWQAMSPKAPEPKSHQARQSCG